MEISMQQTIDEGLRKLRDLRLSDDLHHGENMFICGYAAALMHSRAIDMDKWNEIRELRDQAHTYYMENRNAN